MTRLGLISDVHANLPALQAVLTCLDSIGVEQILCAGDLTAGPNPDETIALLRERNAVMIRGNTDTSLLHLVHGEAPGEWYHLRQYALIRWTAAHIKHETLAYLDALPEERVFTQEGCTQIHIAHGSPGHPTWGIDPIDLAGSLIPAARTSYAQFLLVGHTHCQWSMLVEGVLICNPGSVCGPLDGTIAAQYGFAEWENDRWSVSLFSTTYNLAHIRRLFHESGLLEEGGPLARAFLASINTGQDINRQFLELASRMNTADYPWIPDDILKQAEASFTWPEETGYLN